MKKLFYIFILLAGFALPNHVNAQVPWKYLNEIAATLPDQNINHPYQSDEVKLMAAILAKASANNPIVSTGTGGPSWIPLDSIPPTLASMNINYPYQSDQVKILAAIYVSLSMGGGGGGTVTNVSSITQDISVANPTTTPVLRWLGPIITRTAYGGSIVNAGATGVNQDIQVGTSGSGNFHVLLTTTPVPLTYVSVSDYGLACSTNKIIVDARAGHTIIGTTRAQTDTIQTNGRSVTYRCINDSTWKAEYEYGRAATGGGSGTDTPMIAGPGVAITRNIAGNTISNTGVLSVPDLSAVLTAGNSAPSQDATVDNFTAQNNCTAQSLHTNSFSAQYVNTTSNPYTPGSADFTADFSGITNSITYQLPDATSLPNGTLFAIKGDTNGYSINVITSFGQLIDGHDTIVIAPNQSIIVQSAGSVGSAPADSWIVLITGGFANSGAFLIGQTSGIVSNPSPVSNNEVFLGEGAGGNGADRTNNVYIGNLAGNGETGPSNTSIGFGAGISATGGGSNMFIGEGAGSYSSNCNDNLFVGQGTGTNSSYCTNSTFIGYSAGAISPHAGYSIFIGYRAGIGDSIHNYNSTQHSILIGDSSNTGGFHNSMAVGYGATNTDSGQVYYAPYFKDITYAGFAGGGNTAVGMDNTGRIVRGTFVRDTTFAQTIGSTTTLNDGVSAIIFTSTGTVISTTLILPPNPVSGQTLLIKSNGQITGLTINGNGHSVGALFSSPISITSSNAVSGITLIYNLSTDTWY